MISKRLCSAAAIVLVAGFILAASAAAQEPKATEQTNLAPALQLVPADAAGFVHIRIADLWRSEAFAELRGILAKAGPYTLGLFDKKFVPAPSAIDSVTLIFLTADSMDESIFDGPTDRVSPLLVVTTTLPLDRDRLLKAFGPDAQRVKREGRDYFRIGAGRSALQRVDNRTFVAASEPALKRWLARPAGDPLHGPLADALREAHGKHTWVTGFNAALLPRQPFGPFVPARTFNGGTVPASPSKATSPLWESIAQPVLKARCLTLTVDVASKLHATAKLDFNGEADANEGARAVSAGLQAARAALAASVADLHRDLRDGPMVFAPLNQPQVKTPRDPKSLFRSSDQAIGDIATLVQIGVLRGLDERLEAVSIARQGSSVRVEGSMPFGGNALLVSITAISALGRSATTTFNSVGDSIVPPPAPPAEAKPEAAIAPLVVPAGKRACGLRVHMENLAARAALLPGSRVCVIASAAKGKGAVESKVIVEDALVLALDMAAAEAKTAVITLALTGEELLRVRLAQEAGILTVSLQPPAEPKR